MAMSRRNRRRLFVGTPAAFVAIVVAAVVKLMFQVSGLAFGAITVALVLLILLLALGALEAFSGRDEEKGPPQIEIRRSFWIGLLMPVGLALLFVSERVVGPAHEHVWLWRAFPIACLAAALGWRGYAVSKATGNQRKVEMALLAATLGVMAAIGLYVLGTDTGVAAMGFTGSAAERMGGVLSALWPATLIVSLAALLYMEMAYRVMPVEEAVELRRVGGAAGAGLALSLSFVFVASINYAASERDVVRDLSYFQTTHPSEQSLHMVQRLDEPIEVRLFYPPVNEVLEQLRPYFDELATASDHLHVEVRDHALSFDEAQQHRVQGNGHVLLLRGEGEGQQAETFEVGVDLEVARSRLRTLDARFQQHFAQLTTRPRDIYLTVGHREHSASAVQGDSEGERLGELGSALERSNIQSRNLGVAQGLANEVPEGARAVAVIGPREPFLPEEAQSLLRYASHGGRLLVFVDPEFDHGLDPLLAGLGLRLREGVLHSDRQFMRRRTGEADHSVVYSNTYSVHPSVTLANRYRSQVVSVFFRGGALERLESDVQLPGITVSFPLRSEQGFWLDTDSDHERGPAEPDERFQMIAAVTVPGQTEDDEGRAVIVADGDFITDQLISNRGNAFVLMDSVNWLVGEEHVLGPTQTEEDVPIVHTRDEDEVWFYGTSFGLPIPFLLAGAWLSRRRTGGPKRAPKRRKPPPAPAAPTPVAPSPAAPKEEEE